jgi:hypothetical protein
VEGSEELLRFNNGRSFTINPFTFWAMGIRVHTVSANLFQQGQGFSLGSLYFLPGRSMHKPVLQEKPNLHQALRLLNIKAQ